MDSIFEGSDVGDSDGDEMSSTNGDIEYEQDETFETCVVCNELFNPHFVIGDVYSNECCSERCGQYQKEYEQDEAFDQEELEAQTRQRAGASVGSVGEGMETIATIATRSRATQPPPPPQGSPDDNWGPHECEDDFDDNWGPHDNWGEDIPAQPPPQQEPTQKQKRSRKGAGAKKKTTDKWMLLNYSLSTLQRAAADVMTTQRDYNKWIATTGDSEEQTM